MAGIDDSRGRRKKKNTDDQDLLPLEFDDIDPDEEGEVAKPTKLTPTTFTQGKKSNTSERLASDLKQNTSENKESSSLQKSPVSTSSTTGDSPERKNPDLEKKSPASIPPQAKPVKLTSNTSDSIAKPDEEKKEKPAGPPEPVKSPVSGSQPTKSPVTTPSPVKPVKLTPNAAGETAKPSGDKTAKPDEAKKAKPAGPPEPVKSPVSGTQPRKPSETTPSTGTPVKLTPNATGGTAKSDEDKKSKPSSPPESTKPPTPESKPVKSSSTVSKIDTPAAPSRPANKPEPSMSSKSLEDEKSGSKEKPVHFSSEKLQPQKDATGKKDISDDKPKPKPKIDMSAERKNAVKDKQASTKPEKSSASVSSKSVSESGSSSTPPLAKSLSSPEKSDSVSEKPRRKVNVVGRISSSHESAGQILQEARVQSDLSLSQVEQETKIKKSFLEALEQDDFTNLPPWVWINAYVKKLCSLYGIDERDADKVFEYLKKETEPHHLSEEIFQHLEEEKQVNVEEQVKVRRLITTFIIIILISGATLFAVLYYQFKLDKDSKTDSKDEPEKIIEDIQVVPEVPVTEDEFDKFIVSPKMKMSELPIPEK